MSTSQTSFVIIADTEGHPLCFPFPTHTTHTQTPSQTAPTPQPSTPLHLVTPSPQRVVPTWEPYPRPTNPMRLNLSSQHTLKPRPPQFIPHHAFPSSSSSPPPPPPYSPSSLPSYSPPSSPASSTNAGFPHPIDYEAYTEEYGSTHPAYFLRSVQGTVAPDSALWTAWENAGSEELRTRPGWSILMRDDYEVFGEYVFEFGE